MEKEIYGYIYCIRNLINNKIYFGQTSRDFDIRYKRGIENTHNEHLNKSISKYGIDNFVIDKQFDIAFSKYELDTLERMYITLYNTTDRNLGYNILGGGSNGKHTEESKYKISIANKGKLAGEKHPMYGKNLSEETKRKIGEGNKGKVITAELIAKRNETIRKNNTFKGENNPMYGRKGKLSPSYGRCGEKHPMYGKKHSEEMKKKWSEDRKGKPKSEKTKKLMSENHSRYWLGVKGEEHPLYGRPLSEEVKLKIGEANKGKLAGEKHPFAREVICVTTGKIFKTAKEGGEYYNTSNSSIGACCKGKLKSSGKLEDGTKLVWMYYKDYLKQKNL